MRFLNKITIGKKFVGIFLLIGLTPLILVGWISDTIFKDSMRDQLVKQLISIRELKKDQVEHYFLMLYDQIQEHAGDRVIIDAMSGFHEGFRKIKNEYGAEFESGREEIEEGLRKRYLYQKEHTTNSSADSIERWRPKSDAGLMLQHLYVLSNPEEGNDKNVSVNSDDLITYSRMHRKYHNYIRGFLKRIAGYYDVFLIEPETGYIVYSAFKEIDFATSLLKGPYKSTNFAKVFRAVIDSADKDTVYLADFKPYEPSFNKPAAFIGTSIFNKGKRTGVLVFQMPITEINRIMTSYRKWEMAGMGKSVDTYLVGDNLTMRSDSRYLIENRNGFLLQLTKSGYSREKINKIEDLNTTILLQEVKTIGTEEAFNGNAGHRIFQDYRDVEVLSAYTPLNIKGLNWILMSEIETGDAFKKTDMLRLIMFVVFTGVAGLVCFIGFYIAGIFTAPIIRLSKAVKEIGKGNFNKRIDVESKDEVGVLAESFNIMAEDLQNTTISREQLEGIIKQRTGELSRLNEQLNAVMETATDAIISINSEGSIIFCNTSARTIFGYSNKEMIKKPLSILMPDKFRASHKKALERVLSGSILNMAGKTLEVVGLRKNGEEFPIEVSLSSWKSGEEIFFTAILRDITKRKRTERLLIQADKMTTTARLAAGVVHEVNNPLSNASLSVQELKALLRDRNYLKSLESIDRNIKKASLFTKELLQFSWYGEAEFIQVDINDTIKSAITLLRHKLMHVSIQEELSDIPDVMGDPIKLEQVFINLINNSVDAISEHGDIHIITSHLDGMVNVEISDTGSGISDEDLTGVFDPFFTTKKAGAGSGLGLSISYGIIKQHNGTIEITSKVGKGTTVICTIPAFSMKPKTIL